MDPFYIGVIMIFFLIVTILSGVYVGVSLACLGFIGVWWITGSIDIAARLLGTTSFSAIMDYVFSVIPFFVLMGLFASASGAGRDLFQAANIVTGGTRCGLGIATVLANAVFAAITGVSVASAAIFSKIALPEMLRHGYEKKFALGVVAGSSVLGMLIPPSILLVIYGVLAEEAIGRLLIAGIIPGLLMTLIYSFGIKFMIYRRPSIIQKKDGLSESETYGKTGGGMKTIAKTFAQTWGVVVLIVVSLGG